MFLFVLLVFFLFQFPFLLEGVFGFLLLFLLAFVLFTGVTHDRSPFKWMSNASFICSINTYMEAPTTRPGSRIQPKSPACKCFFSADNLSEKVPQAGVDGPLPNGTTAPEGSINTRRLALSAIFVYQLALPHRFQHGLDLNIGLKAFIKTI